MSDTKFKQAKKRDAKTINQNALKSSRAKTKGRIAHEGTKKDLIGITITEVDFQPMPGGFAKLNAGSIVHARQSDAPAGPR